MFTNENEKWTFCASLLLRGPIFLLKGATKANQGGIPSLQAELEWTGYIQITEQMNNDEKNK